VTHVIATRPKRVLALVATAGIVLVPSVVSAAGEPQLTKPTNVTKADLNPGRMYAAPYLATDPSNPKVIVGATVDLRTRHCSMVVTTDGGVSWRPAQGSPAPNDYPFCVWSNFATQAAMGRDGRAYVAITGWDDRDGGPRQGNMSMIVSRTDDLGTNWRPTIVTPVRGKEGEAVEQHRPSSIAVDSERGGDDIVYLAWNRLQPNRTAPNAEPQRPMFAVSTNGGRTFSEPVDLSKGVWTDALRQQAATSATTTTAAPNASTTTTTAPAAGSRAATPNQEANFGGNNPRIALDDDGNVYVAWRSTTANTAGFPLAPATFVSVSRDRGKTWTTNSVLNYTVGSPSRLVWTKAGGENGSLVMIFGRNPNTTVSGGGDIMIQRSTDAGKTWTEPKNITDDPPEQLVGQFLSTLSVAPNGRLDAAWYDTRDDPGIRANDVYYSYSSDGGVTWSKNMRISDVSINRTYGVWGNNFDVSPPIGLASSDELAVFAWDDTRNTEPGSVRPGEPGGGVQDIFAGTVQHERIATGGIPKVAKVILAAVAGLGIVALALLLAALAAKRRNASEPGLRKTETKAPAKV
jgi:hypothetical protein